MRFVDGAIAAKVILGLGIVLLVAERFWIPADTVFWLGVGFCVAGSRRFTEFDTSPTEP